MKTRILNFTAGQALGYVALVAVLLLTPSVFSVVMAGDLPYGTNPITHFTLCHWDSSDAYKSSGSVAIQAGLNGHSSDAHTNDIIPPFYYEGSGQQNGQILYYAGQNWNLVNEDIWDNGTCLGDGIIPTTGTVTVTKTIDNLGVGSAQVSDFTLLVGSTQVTSGQSAQFTPGAYTLTEQGQYVSQYTATYGGDCSTGSITVVAGQTYDCTILNTYIRPSQPSADLAITKTVNNATPSVAGTIVYTLTVTNNGPDEVSTVVVTDTLPAGLTFVTANPTPDTSAPYTWTIPSLANGASHVITIEATVDSGTEGSTLNNTASVTSAVADPTPTNNSATATLTVATPAYGTLRINKLVDTKYSCSDFSYILDGGLAIPFDDTCTTALSLLAGTSHTITETTASGFVTSYHNCTDVLIEDGKTVVCEITNDIEVVGCMDSAANNYNPEANVPGLCTYDSVCVVGNNMLQNASFEDPVADANTYAGGLWEVFESIPGWLATNSIELWNNMFGGASDGDQNAELDVSGNTRMYQSVATQIGARYALRFDFSPRPDADAASDNIVDALINDAVLMSAVGNGTDIAQNTWTTYNEEFVATNAQTVIAFEDKGTSNGTGSLIDNAVLCLVADPIEGCTNPDAQNYNKDATVDDGSCKYKSSSSGGGGRLLNSDRPSGEVQGESDDREVPESTSTDEKPEGEVEGEQVSVVPTAAPNAGAGGAAPSPYQTLPILTLLVLVGSFAVLRTTEHE